MKFATEPVHDIFATKKFANFPSFVVVLIIVYKFSQLP